MKTKLTHIVSGSLPVIVSLCFLNYAKAQEPITLTYKNFPTPPKANYFYQGANAAGVFIPAPGDNRSWDYSNLTKDDANNSAISYMPASFSAYPNALRQFNNSFVLAGIPIAQTNMEGNDENSYHGLGTHFERQAFSLLSLTGNTTDSLIIVKQNVHEPHQIWQKYPVTYLSSWKSHSISRTDFQLSITAFGLDHTPGQFVQHTFEKREVVGWGKVRIPTASGPSQYIKALLEKLTVLKIDSVYLGGAPAPAALLAAFGVTQGETSNSYYQYRFYRKGIDAYLINFFMDASFTNIIGLNYDTKYLNLNCDNDNNIIASSSESEINLADVTVKVFPNPSPNEFTLNVSGKYAANTSVNVFDLSGKQVQKFERVSGQLKFGKELKAGIYMVQVTQNNQKKTFKLVKSK
jgi:hypothetical protein